MNRDIRALSGPFGYVFHQVAMYAPEGVHDAVRTYRSMGFDEWHRDNALLEGVQRAGDGSWHAVEVSAEMAFNYQALPMELEFLNYSGHGHRHEERSKLSRIPFISHMSVHVDSVRAQMELMKSVYGMEPYWLFVTSHHSNPAVKGKKRFVECIFDTRRMLGYDVKCIERIAWDSDLEAESLLYPEA